MRPRSASRTNATSRAATKHRPRWRAEFLAVLLTVGFLAAACGENDDGVDRAGDATTSSTVPPTHISGAVDTMVGDWGDDGAFIVVMTAFDRGYTAEQVIDAAADSRLQADGTVTDTDPLRPPQGFLSDGPDKTSPTTGQAAAADRPGSDAGSHDQGSASVVLIGASGLSGSDETTPEDRYVADADARLSDVHDLGEAEVARLNEEDAEANFARWVSEMAVALAAQGYSGPQIIEAIFLGDLASSPPGSHENCKFGIAAPGGGYLQPEFPPMAGLGCIAAGDEVSREEQAGADADPTGDTDPSDDGRSGDDGTANDDEAMPSGPFSGSWDDPDPGMFANNPRATGSFESISVEVSGETWTIETAWSTTTPVGGPCSSTVTHSISGSGPLTQDAGGYNLIVTRADGTVIDRWTRERGGDGCTSPWTDSGEEEASVWLFYEADALVGDVEGHPVTLPAG